MKKLLATLMIFILSGFLISKATSVFLEEKPVESVKPEITIPEQNEESYIPIKEDNETNFVASWTTQSSDGNVETISNYLGYEIKILSAGTTLESTSLYRDGIPFVKGNSYVIQAEVSSSTERDIQIVLSNADTSEILNTSVVKVGKDTPIEIKFDMTSESTWNGRVAFYIGNNGTFDPNNEHTIKINEIRIKNISSKDNSVKVNHIGYSINNDKKAVFPHNQGDFFDIVNIDTNKIVYTGAIVNGKFNDKTGETNFTGNFTNVIEPGNYRVESQIVGVSYDFKIGDGLYTDISKELIKFFTIQRCAYALDPSWAFDLAHAACHDTAAIVYDDPTRVIDVNGGWHDAGDYGRYVKTGTKAVNDLMLAYYSNPSFFGDDVGIPESGNGIADVLDEARFELEWLMKMQADWGGVYNKAVTENFPEDISPDQDLQRINVLQAESTTTSGFISTMAIANMVYADVDPTFANECLEKAKKSWENLMNTPDFVEFKNPDGYIAGEYRDDKDSDERYFAAMAMWNVTGDTQYLDYAKNVYNGDNSASKGSSWKDVGIYGSYLFLMNKDATKEGDFYKTILADFKNQADILVGILNADGYQTSLENYAWGSNGYVANNGLHLLFAYDVLKDISYKQGAVEQANYILGKNSLNMTFVSGFGQNSPVNMHHRLAKAKNVLLKGSLVGGPDNDREDPLTQNLNPNTPPAKVYIDQYLSYSSNEVTIYWNSALIYLLSRIN